jgi:hypothetical protein
MYAMHETKQFFVVVMPHPDILTDIFVIHLHSNAGIGLGLPPFK